MNSAAINHTPFKKAVALITVLAVLVTSFGYISFVNPAEAASTHWAEGYLEHLRTNGVMRGNERGEMEPDRNITRAEFTTMINQAFGFGREGSATFGDVPDTAWYSHSIKVASRLYFYGRGNGAAPNENLTREEAISMLCRALKIEGGSETTYNFTDGKDISNWARSSVNIGSEKGIISGYPDGSFHPKAYINRGEAASILARLAGEMVFASSQVSLGYVNGNVTLSESSSGLRNTTITGDLYITAGVETGYVFLDNVIVLGEIIISGGGQSESAENSIVITDCDINKIVVDLFEDQVLSMIAQGNSEIDEVEIRTDAFLEENNVVGSAFKNVYMNGEPKTTLDLSGSFEEVRILKPENIVNLNKGEIERLIVDEEAVDSKIFLEKNTNVEELHVDGPCKVTGTGNIEYAAIGANGAELDMVPEEIYIRPGITVTVDGKKMNHLDADASNARPRIMSGYPSVKEVETTAATGLVKANKPGTVYWALKEKGSGAPNRDNLLEPKEDSTILKSGTMTLSDADNELSTKITGLTSGQAYDLYVMLKDNRDGYSGIRERDFETKDTTSPTFLRTYPKAEAIYQPAETITGEAITTKSSIVEVTKAGIIENENGTTEPGIIKTTEKAITTERKEEVLDTKKEDHLIRVEAVTTKDCTIYWAIYPTGAVAPDLDFLINGRVSGSLKSGKMDAKLNETVTFDITELKEATGYDIYLALQDSKGNRSQMSKLTVTTKDVTAPEFIKPYPTVGRTADTSIQMLVMATEKSTLYWAVYKANAKFPPGYESDVTVEITSDGSIIQSKEAQQAGERAIINGNSSVKYGKLNVPSEQEANFTISGLEAQTTYKLCMFLEDDSGNRQLIYMRDISTNDDVQPTVEMGFEDDKVSTEGYPPVGSDISLIFSEVVYAGAEANATTLKELQKKNPALLNDYIRLYRMNNGQKVEPAIPIDFSKVEFTGDLDNHTVIVFSTANEADQGAVQLVNGADYVFELARNITDLTGNILAATDGQTQYNEVIRLQPFHTMAPFVKLVEPGVTDQNKGTVHTIFEVDPQVQNSAENLYFDTVLESDRLITFELYQIEVTADGDHEIKSGDQITGETTEFTLKPGKFAPLQSLINNKVDADYIKFNNLKRYWYGIKITSVEGNRTESSWNGTVNLSVRAVTGLRNDIAALAASNDQNLSFEDFMASNKAGSLTLVSDPTKLDIPVYFRDMIAPTIEQINVVGGDLRARVDVTLDKPATIYWVVAEKGTFKATPSAIQLENGYRGDHLQSGKFEILNGGVLTSNYIEGLEPKSDYEFYYVAIANEAGEVGCFNFTTKEAEKPAFARSSPRIIRPGQNEVEMGATFTGSSADVYWLLVPSGTTTDLSGIQISEATAGTEYIVDYGNIRDLPEGKEYSFVAKNLKEGDLYDCWIAAKNPLADGKVESNWTVGKLKDIAPLDTSPPTVSARTAMTSVSGDMFPKCSGAVTISFSEPIYYWETSTRTWQKLTEDILKKVFQPTVPGGTATIISATPADHISGFTVAFENAVSGSNLTISPRLGDGMNPAGVLKVDFEFNADNPINSWNAYFDNTTG